MMRALRVLPLIAVLLLASGCLRLRGDLTVSADGLVSGTVLIAVKLPPGSPSGRTLDEVPAELRGKIGYAPYSADGFEGEVLTLRGLTFAELDGLFADTAGLPVTVSAGLKATLSMSRDGDKVVTTGEFSLPTFDDLLGSEDDFEARIRITYPGEVLSTNGQRDGRTVTWTLRQSTVEPIRATASLRDSRSVPWLWGGSGLALLLVLGGAGWWWRRRPAADPPPPYAGPPPGWVAPGAGDWVWSEAGGEPGLGPRRPGD